MGDLLNKAGYTLVTLDADEIVVNYPGIWELMRDLRGLIAQRLHTPTQSCLLLLYCCCLVGMGESSCSWKRPLTLRRDVIRKAEEIYRDRYGNEDGSIPATFCILSFIGWKPDPSQPKSAARGSANVSLKDIAGFVSDQDKTTKK